MNREQVRTRIEEIGVIPALRVSSADDALLAAEAVSLGGIPIVEVTMTVPGALEVISSLVRRHSEMIVGAGTVLDEDTACRCLDVGAQFLTSTGLDPGVVRLAIEHRVVVLPGALTPTEIITAWKTGSDFVKVFPCSQVGGESYIRILKAPFPQIKLIASGGVNQSNVVDFIAAGAAAVGIGGHLIPRKAIELKQRHRITELAHRFVSLVKEARSRKGGAREEQVKQV
jgi:2-dehydro-3-deoxyphosphogluconate aldolase/(4S)-4-hydroxy-2-oxoglutarate aldolase